MALADKFAPDGCQGVPQHPLSAVGSSQPGTLPEARGGASTFSGAQVLVALVGFAVLSLTPQLTATATASAPLVASLPAWVPAAGLGLVLVAWLGTRGGLVVLAGTALVSLWRWRNVGESSAISVAALLAEPPLAALEAVVGWTVFHRLGRGARGLGDPRSAFLFVILLPGVLAGVGAALRAGLAVGPESAGDFNEVFVAVWLGRALGIMVVAPALLTAVTPGLLRCEAVLPEQVVSREVVVRGHGGTDHSDRGDWIEIGGLAVGAGVLGVVLAVLASRQQLAGWQAWGGPLLLLLWASLRQGLRGGTLVASAAAGLPLLVLPLLPPMGRTELHLEQGNALTQCGLALLVAAATSWIRLSEARYRRVVSHVPVVIYSVRVVEPARGTPAGARPQLPRGEITLVSAASDALLGCAPELLLGDQSRWLDRVHPEDREILLAALAQLGRQVQPVVCEYRLAPRPEDRVLDTPPERTGRGTTGFTPVGAASRQRSRWVRDCMAPRFGSDGVLIGWEGVVTEVTEQRILADDLRRTTSMFHTLVNNLPTGVFFVHSPTGHPLLVNARARQLLGQREDISAGLDHLVRVYRLHRADGTPYPTEELPVYQALRTGATVMRDDIVVHRPDGRRIPLVTWAAPLSLAGGKPDAAVWVLEDLTALHQAEAARRWSEATRVEAEGRLRTVFETMGEGLVVQDRAGIVVDCNSAACAILGTPPERLRGQPIDQLGWVFVREDGQPLGPDELPATVVLQGGRPLRNAVLGLLPERSDPEKSTGEEAVPARWLLVNAMPLGEVGAVLTFSDITAYRHTQEVVRASEERYRGLIESLPLIVTQCDRSLRLVYANPALRAVTGYDLPDIAAPQVWQDLVVAEDRPRLLDVLHRALDGFSGRVEARYRAKDGSDKVAFFLIHPRRVGHTVLGATSLIVDITRERRLEGELQRAQRLELVGRLSSGIVHDFNNLLSVVLGLSDLVRAGLPANHPTQADLQRIIEATQQAGNLARQLLTFSNHRQVPSQRVEVTQAVCRTLDLLRATLPSTIEVRLDLSPEDLMVQMDETQLRQIVLNLCLNGREAMGESGRLLVSTALVGDARAGLWVRLAVQDQGSGIPRHLLEKIFDPFFSTKERGTGLGLAVVQQIVHSCGGRIEVFSQPGQGACFEVWLPHAGAEAPTTPADHADVQAVKL